MKDVDRQACIKAFLETRPPYPDFRKTRGNGGYIYLIGERGNPRVKIGYSKNPDTRLRQLQNESSLNLCVLWKDKGNFETERFLHASLEEFSIGNEWFMFETSNPVTLVKAMYREAPKQ